MKKMKLFKEKIKMIFIGTFLLSIICSGSVFATNIELEVNKTDEYKKWENLSIEEKQDSIMPRTFHTEVPESVLKTQNKVVPKVLKQLLGNSMISLENTKGLVTDSRYNLAEDLNIRVENQGITTECWAFSTIKAFETNIALKSGTTQLRDFSERHMDYATSKTFLNGNNKNGFEREVGAGGLIPIGLAYLTNGQGAVLESDMPFKNEENRINIEEIDKEVNTIVTDYSILPTIYKAYNRDSEGNTKSVIYYKYDGTEYTSEEIIAIRNIIKNHLIENGAIASMTAGSISKFYNNENPFEATAYYCNDSETIRDHAITIVGWDDNYSKENFKEGRRPSTDGAYIVLNSYSENVFDNGYMYISYEDYFIEQELYGIASTSNKDYDNIYQHDYYGPIFSVGTTSQDTGYYGVTYERDSSKDEILDSVGISVCDYSDVEIYINPNSGDLDINELIKVGESKNTLEPGYHRINIDSVKLTGEEFAIVVKQTASERFFFQIESNVPNTVFGGVDSEHKSCISFNGTVWANLSSLDVEGIDMAKSDVCIKGFTTIDAVIPDDTNPDDTNPDDTNPDDTNPDDTNPDDTNPDDTNPDDTNPDDTNPDDTNPDDTTPDDTNPDDINPDDTNPDDTNPDDTNPDDTNPDDTNQDDTNPDDTNPDDTAPDDTNPDDTTPDDTNQDDINPDDTNKDITSEKYIIKDEYIMNIEFGISKTEFLKNINTNLEKDILTQDNKEVSDSDKIKTGMKLKLSDGREYILVIRGDINLDGNVTITDLSKLILHYNEVKGFELKELELKGADMNCDGVINLVDVSQLVVYYNSI